MEQKEEQTQETRIDYRQAFYDKADECQKLAEKVERLQAVVKGLAAIISGNL